MSLTEKDYVEKIITLKAKLKQLKDETTAIEKDLQRTIDELVDMMTIEGKTETATYDGIGFIKIREPRIFARCNSEYFEDLKSWLKSIGRDDVIKETVHPSSLSQVVKEYITEGKDLPEIISYYIKPQITVYDRRA